MSASIKFSHQDKNNKDEETGLKEFLYNSQNCCFIYLNADTSKTKIEK